MKMQERACAVVPTTFRCFISFIRAMSRISLKNIFSNACVSLERSRGGREHYFHFKYFYCFAAEFIIRCDSAPLRSLPSVPFGFDVSPVMHVKYSEEIFRVNAHTRMRNVFASPSFSFQIRKG